MDERFFASTMDTIFHIKKSERKKEKRCRENREREREREKCGWKRLSIGSGAADSGAAGCGVASNERGSVVGMKMGRKGKENVKKKRK